MPTNVYFDTGTRPEQNLYEDLMIEQLKIYGQDVFYIPRTLVKEDELFGEDTLSKFGDAYLIEMYFENVEGYEGEKEIMSKFGLQMNEDVTFVVARRRFEQLVSHDSNLIVKTRPNEGDLVYFPKVNKIFEISFVDHDDPFYQVHNVPAFKLKCKTFEYGGEDIDTGITEIDAIETANSLDMLTFQITMEQSSTTTFNEGIELEDGTGNLELETQTGGTDNVIGEDETGGDNVVLETGDYIIQEAYVTDTIDENAMNDFFDKQDDNIIDFTESNPFGDVGKVG
tara:strand:+ start:773 stop:1621 length:849 start_codon:yes stop_codon:yes gene_type:complete